MEQEAELTCSQVQAVSLRETRPPVQGPPQGLVRVAVLFVQQDLLKQASGSPLIRTAETAACFVSSP